MGRPLDEMTFIVTRRPGVWDGAWTFGAFSTFTFKASRPQPVGPEAIDFMDEGARTLARYVVYAHDDQPDLYSARALFAADTIAYNGKTYSVTTDDDYHDMPLGYRAYILLEFGADETAPAP